MSSADRWRVLLPSRSSRIFKRGSVTFSPALRRSLPSTAPPAGLPAALAPRRSAIRYDFSLHYPPSDTMRLIASRLTLVSLAVLLAAGCVYRPDVQQGNWIEAKTVDQVQPGMTRTQVRYLMGTPMVPDVFDKDRWDYLYYFQ